MDPEIAEILAAMPQLGALSSETLPLMRPYSSAPLEPLLEGRPVLRREETILSHDGAELLITVLSPQRSVGLAPGVLWLHGGGMVMGDRFSQIDIPIEWLEQFGAVVVSVEYRLAPEATGTTLVEDGYAGLCWLAEHAEQLGVDPQRLVVAGTSAGGGIAAGVTLLARDSGAPAVAAQVLICPMLDYRGVTVSTQQFPAPNIWARESNAFAWNALFGGTVPDSVSPYVSPAIAEDVSGLPTTYIDAGSAEVFRDEDQAYAARIWAAGGQAELHVWAGGTHGFDAMAPHTALGRAARETRTEWLRRVIGTAPAS